MIRPTLLVFLTLAGATALAQNPAPHQHGVARLDVALDRNTLRLEFSSPLDNILGFEHTPRNTEEKSALEALIKRLQQGGSLFTMPPEAECTLVSADVHSPFSEAPKAGKPAAHKHDHRDKADQDHADLDADYLFRCTTPAAARALEVRLFQHFPRLRQIDVQAVLPAGQRGARLTPQNSTLRW
ncbi:MAG: DUF2796 domain-containing protein [Rhodocyclaceae bacterium]|nr:DUF2796 domain-containing protein [Rhodocyclaceae bacterium]